MLFRSVTNHSIRLWCALGVAQERGRPNSLNSIAPPATTGIEPGVLRAESDSPNHSATNH